MADTGAISLPSFAKRTSLREQVTNALRAAIVSGQMVPGRIYSAPTLVAGFGVSATPVREAMLDLAKQGLIDVVPNRGFQVAAISDAELDHITEIRLLLEPPVAVTAATRATAADIAALRALAEMIVAGAERGDLISYVEADREFHGRLVALNDNPRLVDIVYDLRDQTRLYGLASLAQPRLLDVSAREHLTMCDCLESGDGGGLAQLMRRHIGRVRREWATGRSD